MRSTTRLHESEPGGCAAAVERPWGWTESKGRASGKYPGKRPVRVKGTHRLASQDGPGWRRRGALWVTKGTIDRANGPGAASGAAQKFPRGKGDRSMSKTRPEWSEEATRHADELLALRRDFHRHPEL